MVFAMNKKFLLQRLDEIGKSLEQSGHAVALFGLGSVGQEIHRLDDYSDLDFFAIVEKGFKKEYINHIDWLRKISPVAYHFQNTADGHKLLFADGIFCEFAVFEERELPEISYAPGRIVWKRADVSARLAIPVKKSAVQQKPALEWFLGEALTNLYVGLARDKRGEKLSAMRFIQIYAVDRVVELAELIEKPTAASSDHFAHERRFEQRYPAISEHLPQWMQGYDRNNESALALLDFLEEHFEINRAIASEIRKLAIE